MRKLIIYLMLILAAAISVQAVGHSYEVSLHYNRGNITLNYAKVILSSEAKRNSFGSEMAKIVSADNKTINYTFFGIPKFILTDSIDETGKIVGGEKIEINETDIIVYLPYYENANEIIIYNENLTKKLSTDVSRYSKKEVFERNVSAEAANVTTGAPEAVKPAERPESNLGYIVLILAIVVIVIAIFIARKKLQKQEAE